MDTDQGAHCETPPMSRPRTGATSAAITTSCPSPDAHRTEHTYIVGGVGRLGWTLGEAGYSRS